MRVPEIDDIIKEANTKGIKPFHISRATGLADSTVTRFFSGENTSYRNVQKIVNYINKQK